MNKKCLIAYFSASGTTAKVAERLAEVIHGDLYEIEANPVYSNDDLNWNDKHSRSYCEWKDKNCRPAIKTPVADMEQYEVVFLGFPIWWEESPRIILSFLESYDFSGKTVVPFSTSGGSVRGSDGKHLQKHTSKTTVWKKGKLIRSGCSLRELSAWVDSLKL